MKSGNPLMALHDALAHARLVQLLPVRTKRFARTVLTKEEAEAAGSSTRVQSVDTGEWDERRPYDEELAVHMFPQVWGSTALGFGGIGGAAMTTADTVVVCGPAGDAAVYFGGGFAYHIQEPTQKFYEDLESRNLSAVSGSRAYHKPRK